MIKYIMLLTAVVACSTTSRLSAGRGMSNYMGKGEIYGTQVYGKETIDEIRVNGFVKLDGTIVSDYLQVNGRLKAEDAQIEEMQINGQATLDYCSLRRKSTICGALIATFSKFAEELSISSERVIIDSCESNSLRILQIGGYRGIQVVELRGKTKITGSIIFESGNGEVVVSPESEITGAIIGGQIR